MLASVVWYIIPPFKLVFGWSLFVSVTLQELFRALLYIGSSILLSTGSGDGAEAFIRPGYKNEILTGFSVGIGYAIMSVLVIFFPLLIDDFWNDTSVYIQVCPINFFAASAAFAMAYSVLHMLLGILAWPAYASNAWDKIIIVYIVHLLLSEASLFNRRMGGCQGALPLILVSVFCFGIFVRIEYKIRMRTELSRS